MDTHLDSVYYSKLFQFSLPLESEQDVPPLVAVWDVPLLVAVQDMPPFNSGCSGCISLIVVVL